MSDGKKIEIQIATTGGDQAAGEIKKVGDASEETGKKVASMEDQTAPDSGRSKVDRLKEVAIATGAIGIAAGLAKKSLSDVWEQLDKVDTVELRNLDSAMADQIENARKLRDALEDPIGALVALANGGTTLKEAFGSLDEQMKLNAEGQSAAVDRLLAKSDTQVQTIKRLAEDIKAANELLEAQTATARTIRDGKNAEAIRNGADPDDIAAAEAKKRAEEDITAIEGEQNAARSGLQTKYDAAMESRKKAEQAKAADDKINSAGELADSTETAYKNRSATASDDEVWAMKNAALAAKSDFDYTKRTYQPQATAAPDLQKKAEEDFKAFEAQKAEIARVDALAAERKANIRAGADNSVRDAEASKAARLKAEDDRKQEEERKAAEKAARQARQDDFESRRDGLNDGLESKQENLKSVAAGNKSKIVGGTNPKKQLQDLANDIGSADTSAEIAAVKEKINASQAALGSAVVGALNEMVKNQSRLVKDVEILRQQIKKMRPMGG